MLGVIAIPAAQNHRAGKSWMPELRCDPLPPGVSANPAFSKSEINWRILRGISFVLIPLEVNSVNSATHCKSASACFLAASLWPQNCRPTKTIPLTLSLAPGELMSPLHG
jgi:hypothetical protein